MTGKINSIKGDDSDEPVFITNPDLDATADIIALIRSEFEGVKSDLKVFEKIKNMHGISALWEKVLDMLASMEPGITEDALAVFVTLLYKKISFLPKMWKELFLT